VSARLTVQFWRDIPVAVVAQSGRTRHELQLPRRFQRAVELCGGHLVPSTTATTAAAPGWWLDERVCSEDLELEVTSEMCRIESIFSRNKLVRLTSSGGFDEYRRNRLQVVRPAS
jgi:hypothetical protein